MGRLNDTEAIRTKMPGGAPRGGSVGDSIGFESLDGQMTNRNYRPASWASRVGFVTGRRLSVNTGSGPEGQDGAHEELCKPTPRLRGC